MLTKLLFTGLVILAVYLFYRNRGRGAVQAKNRRPAPVKASATGRFAAYGFIVLLLLISGGIYYFQWREAHRIITIRVIDGNSSSITTYKAYQKSIKGNRFESLDGKSVVLGEAERVEYTDND